MHNITFKTYLLTFVSNFGIQLATLLQGVMLARILGVGGRGAYTAIMLWPTFFAGIGLFGTNIVFGQYAAKHGSDSSAYKTAFAVGGITGICVSIICFFSLPFLLKYESWEVLNLAKIFVPYILLNHLIMNLSAIYWGCADFKKFNLIFVIYYPFFLGGLLMSYLFGFASIRNCVYLTIGCNIIVLSLILYESRKNFFQKSPLLPLKDFFKKSLPFGFTTMIQTAIIQIDRFIVLYCLGNEKLGLYIVALSAGSALSSIGTATSQVIFSRCAQQDVGKGFDYVAFVFKSLLVINVIGGGGMAIIMPWLLPLFYGKMFRPAAGVACLLLPGFICSSLSGFLEQSLRGQGLAFRGIGGRFISMILMLVLGVIFCRKLGLNGMGIAYFLSQSIGLLYLLIICKYHYQDAHIRDFFTKPKDILFLCKNIFGILHLK